MADTQVPTYEIKELLRRGLEELYGEATPTVLRQATAQLKQHYHGDVSLYLDKFFSPAIQFLRYLKQANQLCCACHNCWPLAHGSCVIVHLQDLKQSELAIGEFYLFLAEFDPGQVQLVLKYCSNDGSQELHVLDCRMERILTMDWLENLKIKSDIPLGRLLQQCLVALEQSIMRLRWDDLAHSQTCQGRETINRPADSQHLKCGGNTPDGSANARNHDSVSSPKLSPDSQHRTKHKLDSPKTILDIDYILLQSGVAILPGCRDRCGGAVIYVFTCSSVWQNQQVSSTELARLFMYYFSVPRKDITCKGLSFVVDIRGCVSSTINTLLKAFSLFEGIIPGAISIIHVLADKNTQSMVLRSPVYDPHAPFQFDILMSMDVLLKFIDVDQLPAVLDGHFVYSHDDWIRFHMKLDPFLAACRETAEYLVEVMQRLSSLDFVPKTAKETSQLIEEHEQTVKNVFERQSLVNLQNEGNAIMDSLKNEGRQLSNSDDYRDAMGSVDSLYHQLQDAILKLVRLGDVRLNKLEHLLQLQELEEECNKVISWLQTTGKENLQKFTKLGDNLKIIRVQQKDFEKFYFLAMKHIERGNDLLEDASMLSQSGNFDETTGYKELARTLKRNLQCFCEHLEEMRERIEGSAHCYQLLDKCYEWALEAMKYVASMKMEHCGSLAGLDKLVHSLDHYLQQHPPLGKSTFDGMVSEAKRVGNERLLEQCHVAKARCEETHQLLHLRQNTLRKAMEQLRNEQKQKEHAMLERLSDSTSSPCHSVGSANTSSPHKDSFSDLENSVWEPQANSTPTHRKVCRDSTERLPISAPSSINVPVIKCEKIREWCDGDGGRVRGGSDSAVDLSHRVVTPIPKIHSEATLRLSREDLTDMDNSNEDSRVRDAGPSSVFTSRHRPMKKVLKRSSTAPLPDNVPVIEEDQDIKCTGSRNHGGRLSMLTASSDSLPSLIEEEEEEELHENENLVPDSAKLKTPVPVNTHLHQYSRQVLTGSLADLHLTEEEVQTRRTLSLITREMVQTERDYVSSLRFIVDNYIPELQREDVPQALRGKRNVIFGNIEKICQFHQQYFLREVEACRRNIFHIAQYFIMHESQFQLYALYNKNKPRSDSLMAENGKRFFSYKQRELGDMLDLSSYLLKPVQRMGKYALLIKQMIKECPASQTENLKDLKEAEEMVKFQLRHGNDLLAMDALRECDVNLGEQGRLLRQEEFLIWQGRRKFLRQVFLFEDMVLFSKTRRGRQGAQDTYIYKFSFKMSDIGLTEDFGESGYKFELWFRRRAIGDNYVLQAPSSEVKKKWVKDISRLLWNQAVKNRETHMSQMARMGVGSRPCLDIKPSSDNIQDRFVNIAVANRGARSRNSIAVSSFDHLRENNKRPHSIISVSSGSSSSSGQSCLVSPKERQQAQQSAGESGIVSDMSSSDMESHPRRDKQGVTLKNTGRSYLEFVKSKVFRSGSGGSKLSTDV
ncbi:hypothetical protein ScPMuIL_000995 [Solemya velum]